MRLVLSDQALVLLIGAAGSGKSTFGRAHFKSTEVISSDFCRALVSDDERDQSATPAAFQVLHLVVGLRLKRRRLTVVDAVNATRPDRRGLLALAEENDCRAVAIVLDLPEKVCVERDAERPGRRVGPRVIHDQHEAIRRSLPDLAGEGFAAVHVLGSAEAAAEAAIELASAPVNRRWERGPFDIIGDVHGCLEELVELLQTLGYSVDLAVDGSPAGAVHFEGRRAVFVGDLAGRGANTAGVVGLVGSMLDAQSALLVRGDQDEALEGRLGDLPSHLVLDRGRLVVVHVGITSSLQGRDSPRVTRFAVYGEGADGWLESYRGRALVVHGHVPVAQPEWRGRTIDIDTGCALGGRLTALRYPELQLVSVPAALPHGRQPLV